MENKLFDNTLFNIEEVEVLSIPSKTMLLEEGKIADKLYFIRKGCLRLFFYNEGKYITFQFFFEGDFVASFDSLYKGTPSLFSLESIEHTEPVLTGKYRAVRSSVYKEKRLLQEDRKQSFIETAI